jgi:hypothetical protein
MKYTTIAPIAALVLLAGFAACRSAPVEPVREDQELIEETADIDDAEPVVELPPPGANLPVSSFGEIWAYVVAGREAALKRDLPISDIAYFGAEIDSYGSLTDAPVRRKLPSFPARVHLVAACSSRSLTHFVLAPGSAERKTLIADLLEAAKDFDGLQIDFEYVPQRDGGNFLSFLAELRTALGGKMFTIALPARSKKVSNDVYDYEKIRPLVDRVLVMAYDEHWSTSKPGPVASLPWCKRVADYSLKIIGGEKLIMGIPFYGRAWGDTNPSRALLYSGVEDVITGNRVAEIRRENGIPTFDYDVSVSVKVYYEDDYSLSARMEMYKSLGVRSVGFWRLGQETQAVWDILRLEG